MNFKEAKGIVERYVGELKRTGFRGLLVIEANTIDEVLSIVGGLLSKGRCLGVATKGIRYKLNEHGCETYSPMDIDKVLGSEYEVSAIALEGLTRPNIIAAVAGTVVGGGVLILALLSDALKHFRRYKNYLFSSFCKAENVLWLKVGIKGIDVKCMSTTSRSSVRRSLEGVTAPGVPKAISSLVMTVDQLEALKAVISLMKGKLRSLLIHGDRGRGKSYVLGLALAAGFFLRLAGRVTLTAPSPWSVQTLMRGLLEGLKVLKIENVKVSRNRSGAIVRISGPWFKLSYESPETIEASPLIIIDEAAAVGVARVRRLAWRSTQVIASTTVHGYEGSGRALLKLVEEVLPKPRREVEMKEPIRYPPEDPLELWSYKTFHLRPEPLPLDKAEISVDNVSYEIVDRESFIQNDKFISDVMNLLALAHYRNEPDDLLMLLEAENHYIHILRHHDRVVAVADVALESDQLEEPARIGLKKLYEYTLTRGLRAARVVRIAVHPEVQRRGLGSYLLRQIEEWSRGIGVDVVLSIFSRHEVLDFWFKNNYVPYYVSPRYNKVTGEKNVAVSKGLTPRGMKAVEEASRELRLKLLLSSSSIYRDLAAEKIVKLLRYSKTLNSSPIEVRLSESSMERLKRYVKGELDYEQASEVVLLCIIKCLLVEELSSYANENEAIALVARVIQGKPLDEVAKILGVDIENANAIVNNVVRNVVRRCVLQG